MSTEKRVPWHTGAILGADTETTAPDPGIARIVTTALVYDVPGRRPARIEWLIDPGVEIPAEAAAVHGWTRDRLVERIGQPDAALRIGTSHDNQVVEARMTRAGALDEIVAKLEASMHIEMPVVAANAAYDFTVLEHEATRNAVTPLSARPGGVRGVVDPMVIERQWDPFRSTCYARREGHPCDTSDPDTRNHVHVCGGCRKGKYACGGCGVTNRRLESLDRHYHGPGHLLSLPAAAHDASYDALAAVQVTRTLGRLWPATGRLLLPTLFRDQVKWRKEQMDGFREWKDKKGEPHDGFCPEWPIHAACATTETAVA